MLSKKMWSKFVLLLAIMVASISLPSMSKVSAACKPEHVESIEEQIEEYVSTLEQEVILTVRYSNAAIKEKEIGRTMRATLKLDEARKFAEGTKKTLAQVKNLVEKTKNKRTQQALLNAIQLSIKADKSVKVGEAALTAKNEEVESAVVKASSDYNLKLLSAIEDKK